MMKRHLLKLGLFGLVLINSYSMAQTSGTWSDIPRGSRVITNDNLPGGPASGSGLPMPPSRAPEPLTTTPTPVQPAPVTPPVKREVMPNSIAVTELGFTKNIAEREVREAFEADDTGLRSARSVTVKRLTEYLELRGLTSNIRAALIKEGLPVIEAGSGITIAEGDERAAIFDVKRRVQKGEFNNAEFVLLGTLVDFSPIMRKSIIPGTDAVLYEWGLDLVADFKLINTETMQITAAFTATGVGVEKRLVNTETAAGTMLPRRAKIVADISNSLAKNAARLLADQGVLLGQDPDASTDARLENKKYMPFEDKNLKVYK